MPEQELFGIRIIYKEPLNGRERVGITLFHTVSARENWVAARIRNKHHTNDRYVELFVRTYRGQATEYYSQFEEEPQLSTADKAADDERFLREVRKVQGEALGDPNHKPMGTGSSWED